MFNGNQKKAFLATTLLTCFTSLKKMRVGIYTNFIVENINVNFLKCKSMYNYTLRNMLIPNIWLKEVHVQVNFINILFILLSKFHVHIDIYIQIMSIFLRYYI